MNKFENAKKCFETLEGLKGWDGCKEYVADGASFAAQCEPLVEVTTVQAYCDWVTGFGTVTALCGAAEPFVLALKEEGNG